MASGIIDLGSSGKMSGRISWSSSSNGPQNNSSNVTATLQVRRNDSYGPTTGTFTGSLFIHDEQQDYSVHARVSSDWITLKSFSKTVGHSGDGKGSCHIWGNISGPSGTSMSGSYVEADTWVTLDTIPRYANFIEHWISATGLNSVTVHWATDAPCDRIQYSLNGGGWTDTASTNYTVGGLAPSTRYTIKSRTRRTDSQLWNESGTLTFTTKSISAVQSWTQLTLPAPGTNNTTIKYKISNDSGNATYVYLERNNAGDNYGCNSGSTSVTSGDKTLTLSSTALNQIYNEHASVTAPYDGDVNKRATSGMQLTTRTSGLTNYYNNYGVTFIMTKANCGPTAIKDFTCQEQQADVAALTGCSTSKTYTNGNGLIVLKGYSNVKINVAANPLSVRAGASNKAISINGSEWLTSTSATSKTLAGVTINNFSITAKDSRDFSLSKSSTDVTLKTYTPVNISSLRIDRGDGVSTTAYLTLAGNYNALNFGAVTNSISSVKLQIKTKNTAWTAKKITGATTGVIDATKVNEYTITNLLTASSGNIACSAKELKVSGTSGNSLQFVLGTDYDARIIVYDQLTSKSSFSNQVVYKDTSIASGRVLFSAVKNSGVSFGGFYTAAIGGALQVNSNSFFAFGDNSNSSIAAPTNGNGIILGADGANKTSANMRLFSWYGISFTTSCENQTIPVGQSAVYINCRTGELTARGNVYTVGDKGDVRYWATRSDTGASIWYGVGSGGTNRGLYDVGMNKWMIYSDGTNVYLGNKAATYKIGEACSKGVKTLNTDTDLSWTSQANGDAYLITKACLSFWNGRYNSANSNLQYSRKGEIPSPANIVTAGIDRKSWTITSDWGGVAMLPFNWNVPIGDKLTVTNEGIRVGAGVSRVLLTANCEGINHSACGGDKIFHINRKRGNTVVSVISCYNSNMSYWHSASCATRIEYVQEGDIFYLELASGARGTIEVLPSVLTVEVLW